MHDELNLTVQVSAAEWSYCQRRLRYLHSMLVRVLRDQHGVPEWYSAAELATLRLPGLPNTREAITKKARLGGWMRRQGGDHPGERVYRYHVSSLPARAFDCLIERIWNMPAAEEEEWDLDLEPLVPPSPSPGAFMDDGASSDRQSNTTPAWVLPLMRLIKGKAKGDLSVAWQELPLHIPEGVRLPSVEEAAVMLIELGIAGT